MCGPLVAGYAIALRDRAAALPHLLFHLGRVTTYGIAGGIVGASGSFVRVAAWLPPPPPPLPSPPLLFHRGRVPTYGSAGGIVGASGSFVRVAAWLAPLQQLLLAGTGVLIALMGLSVGGWLPRARRIEGAAPFGGALAGVARRAAEAGGPGAAFPLGMATGLLPCGL